MKKIYQYLNKNESLNVFLIVIVLFISEILYGGYNNSIIFEVFKYLLKVLTEWILV